MVKILNKNFKMKDLGEASSILGIRITRDLKEGKISIDQSIYIEEILRKFKMSDCNAISSPLDVNQKLSAEMCPKNPDEKKERRSCRKFAIFSINHQTGYWFPSKLALKILQQSRESTLGSYKKNL